MAIKSKKLVQIDFAALCAVVPVPPLPIKELADHAAGENSFVHVRSGAVAFTDAAASHSASVTPLGSGYLGTFTVGAINEAANTVGWTFKLSDGLIDHLQAGQTLLQTYRIAINDGHGHTTVKPVTLKIVGTNDAPVITSPPQGDSITENSPFNELPFDFLHQAQGDITFKDVDTLDTHTAKVVPIAGGYLGTLSIGSVNQATDTIHWTYTVADNILDPLTSKDTVIQTYLVTVDDGHGGKASQTITITLHGTDDFIPSGPAFHTAGHDFIV